MMMRQLVFLIMVGASMVSLSVFAAEMPCSFSLVPTINYGPRVRIPFPVPYTQGPFTSDSLIGRMTRCAALRQKAMQVAEIAKTTCYKEARNAIALDFFNGSFAKDRSLLQTRGSLLLENCDEDFQVASKKAEADWTSCVNPPSINGLL